MICYVVEDDVHLKLNASFRSTT